MIKILIQVMYNNDFQEIVMQSKNIVFESY